MGSLPRNQTVPCDRPVTAARRPRGWGRPLSTRRVRKLICVEQIWEHLDGSVWTVLGLHRADRSALISIARGELPSGSWRRVVTFAELGREYRPPDGGTAG